MNDRTQLANHTQEPTHQVAAMVFSLIPKTLNEAMELAKIMADSDLMPKDYRGKPANILVAVQMGLEIGLKPIQAVQNIAVINGRPSLYGDALWALVKSSPLCESTKETFDDATMTATCVIKRRGEEAVTRTFSKADAEKAKLWGKEGPWQGYPKRMLQMRARGFCARDAVPEALKGFSSAEEARDIPPEREIRGERIEVEQPRERKQVNEAPLPFGGEMPGERKTESEGQADGGQVARKPSTEDGYPNHRTRGAAETRDPRMVSIVPASSDPSAPLASAPKASAQGSHDARESPLSNVVPGALAPTQESAAPQTGNPSASITEPAASAADLATAEQRRYIKVQMDRASLGDREMLEKFGFDLSGLPKASVNDVIKWISNPF